MAQADLLARLEAVTVRLERAAARMGGGGGGDDGDEVPMFVTEFQNIVKQHLPKVIAACNALGFDKSGDMLQRAFDCVVDYISKVPKSKKPTAAESTEALAPGFKALKDAQNQEASRKNPVKNRDYYKSIIELIEVIRFVQHTPSDTMSTPARHIEGARDATDFNLLKVQRQFKDDNSKEFVKTIKAFFKALCEWGNQYFKKDGLTWNPKGASIGSVSAGGAVTTSGSNDDKKEATPSKKAAPKKGGGMGALFGSINAYKDPKAREKLLARKVKDEDKSKNRKDRSGKVTMKAAPKKAARNKPEAIIYENRGQIMVENHNEGIFDIEKVTMKTSVFISRGDGATYTIKNKAKSVMINNCIKCRVFVSEVVSIVEVVNCKKLQIIIQKKVPSVSIDKSDDPRLILTKEAYESQPTIITSNVSAMNIQIPGKTEKDDPIDIPVPDQFQTTVDPKTGIATTVEVKHE